MRLFHRRKIINLALQGGGAHGAFTWGVLDRLLQDDDLEIRWISGTSAGALNAVALAAGWARDGRAGARKNLKAIWKAIYDAGVPGLLRLNPFLRGLSNSPTLSNIAGLWSPYDINPLRIDPLRQLIEKTVDFDALRDRAPQELLIAATDVATGNARLFRRHELTVECILASACLPTIQHAVKINNRSYWDGGFSANPDIVTLAEQSPCLDTLIVQLNPLVQAKVPRSVNEIAGHMNQLTFNAPLKRDVQLITTARKLTGNMFARPTGPLSALARHRFHLIDAGHHTGSLSPRTKMKPDWGLFTYLFDAGRLKTERWLQSHRHQIGHNSTVDLEDHFLRRPQTDAQSQTDPTERNSKPPAPAKDAKISTSSGQTGQSRSA